MSDVLSFDQSQRLLKITFSEGAGIPPNTVHLYELSGTEGISQGFRYKLTCLTTDATLPLKQLLGVPTQVAILTDDGTERALCGLVTEAHQEGGDGGFARFTLVLEDPLTVLKQRINARVFQDLSVLEFCQQILSEHRHNNPVLAECWTIENHCQGQHPKQSWATQFNESDNAFIRRWFAQEGISWYYEHGDRGAPAEQPQLTLVLFDDVASLQPASAAQVKYHRADATEPEDTITEWHGTRALQSSSIQRSSYDFKQVLTNSAHHQGRADQGDYGALLASTLEDYRYDSHFAANDGDDYARYGKLRAQAHDYATKLFTGSGTHRELAVGRYFELAGHPVHGEDLKEDRYFTITGHLLYARNNLPAEIHRSTRQLLQPAAGLDSAVAALAQGSAKAPDEPVFQTRFTASRKDIPIVPAYSATEHAKPVAPASITALVVGPPGEEIHVNEYGAVKVIMGFVRSKDQEHAGGAGATYSDRDSKWVRVQQPWAGAHYGHLWVPRVNDEVIIQFLGGDLDRPVITGSVFNGTHKPPAASGAGNLPGNKTLSIIQSKMYKGSGANEIVLDDTTAEQRVRIATDHDNTALNLGFLVDPRNEGKGKPRGEGAEITTDAYAAIRAGKGMLLSTDARPHANSTHLDSKELTTQMQGSLALSKVLSDAAAGHHAGALEVNTETERLLQVVQTTYAQSGGTGQKADVPGYAEPILALSSPAGIIMATPKSHQIAAGEHLHLSSQQDTNVAVGKKLVMAIKDAWSVFVATAGIKLFAGKGKVEIQAQDDALEATAKRDIKITSVAGNIEISAPAGNSLTLNGGGCQITMSGNNVDIKAPGAITLHGAMKNLTGPASGSASGVLPALPMKPGDMVLKHLYENGEPIASAKYKAILPGGEVRTGSLDAAGKATLTGIPAGAASVLYKVDPRPPEHKPAWEPTLPPMDNGLMESAPTAQTSPSGQLLAQASGLAQQAAGLVQGAAPLAGMTNNIPGLNGLSQVAGAVGKANSMLAMAGKGASALPDAGIASLAA